MTKNNRDAANIFWAGLDNAERWEIGDELVLGDLDLPRWFDGKKPTSGFLAALDNLRMIWEMQQ